MVHTLRLDNYSPTPRKLVLGTNSSFGTESIKIERGAGWDGLNLTATWHIPGREEPLRVALLDGDAMDVPPEVTKEAKDGVLVLAGLASGVQRASCNVDYLILEQAGVYGGADAEPTPELAAQVLEAALQAKADAEAAAADAAKAGPRKRRRPVLRRRKRQRPQRRMLPRPGRMRRRRLPPNGLPRRPWIRLLPRSRRRRMRLLPRRPVRAQRTRWRRRLPGPHWRRRNPRRRQMLRPTWPERMLQLHSRRRRMRLLPLTMRARAPATPRPVRRRRRLPHRLRRRHRLLRLLPGTMR